MGTKIKKQREHVNEFDFEKDFGKYPPKPKMQQDKKRIKNPKNNPTKNWDDYNGY
jgi:hypothetical protein